MEDGDGWLGMEKGVARQGARALAIANDDWFLDCLLAISTGRCPRHALCRPLSSRVSTPGDQQHLHLYDAYMQGYRDKGEKR